MEFFPSTLCEWISLTEKHKEHTRFISKNSILIRVDQYGRHVYRHLEPRVVGCRTYFWISTGNLLLISNISNSVIFSMNQIGSKKTNIVRCVCQNIFPMSFRMMKLAIFYQRYFRLMSHSSRDFSAVNRAVAMLQKIGSDNWEITFSYSITINTGSAFVHTFSL